MGPDQAGERGAAASGGRTLLAELAAWLVEATDATFLPAERFDGYCRRLTAVIPLSRISLILETLHPEDSGIRATWQEGALDPSFGALDHIQPASHEKVAGTRPNFAQRPRAARPNPVLVQNDW